MDLLLFIFMPALRTADLTYRLLLASGSQPLLAIHEDGTLTRWSSYAAQWVALRLTAP